MQKYIIIICFIIHGFAANAQIGSIVCIGAIRNYMVQGDAGSVYNWHVNGGSIISDPVKDSITVKWGNIGGIYIISVIETNIHGCPGDTIFTTVIVNPLYPINISGPDEICNGETITLTANNAYTYNWSTGSVTKSIDVQPASNTIYGFIGSTSCSIDTVYHYVTVHQKPVPDFKYSPVLPVIKELINLTYTGTIVNTYSWYNESDYLFSTQTNPDYTVQNQINPIKLIVTDQFGCVDSISKTVIADGKIDVWIPNTFTPNGDGLNDIFKVESSLEVKDFNLYIYNRWGQLVFESNNINFGWDGYFKGEKAPQGVYNWTLIYKSDYNSENISRKKGQITLYY